MKTLVPEYQPDKKWQSTTTNARALAVWKFIMSLTICVSANASHYPEGGGVLWEYLNWTLGFRSLGCNVIWAEGVKPGLSAQEVQGLAAALEQRLEKYGLGGRLALVARSDDPLAPGSADGYLDLDAAAEADLLVNMGYRLPSQIVKAIPAIASGGCGPRAHADMDQRRTTPVGEARSLFHHR